MKRQQKLLSSISLSMCTRIFFCWLEWTYDEFEFEPKFELFLVNNFFSDRFERVLFSKNKNLSHIFVSQIRIEHVKLGKYTRKSKKFTGKF